MSNDPNKVIEEKIAFLERHITEQDKAMLQMADDISRLRRELRALRDRASNAGPGSGGELPDQERPPHY